MRNAKVVSRKLARVGGLVYTLAETTKDAKGVESTKEFTSMLTTEQIQTANLVGLKLPAVGDTVGIEASVNPGTGLVNEQWVNISL